MHLKCWSFLGMSNRPSFILILRIAILTMLATLVFVDIQLTLFDS
jgi:hypothetical protein